MKKLNVFALAILALSPPVWAMESLNDYDLTEVTGQAGADLSFKFRLNHNDNAQFDTALCSDMRYCRLGLSLNNRYHDGTQDTVDPITGVITASTSGRKQWLVLKGIQGTVIIPELRIDGSTVTWSNGGVTQPAVVLGFSKEKPIEIRNFGFQSLAIETDTVAAEGAGNTPGYLVSADSPIDYTGFDAGREKGFIGLNINSNLSITGHVKMFACGSNHPRC